MSKPLAFKTPRGYITENGLEIYTESVVFVKGKNLEAVSFNGKVITFAKDKAVAIEFMREFVESSFQVAGIKPLEAPDYDFEVEKDG